MDISVIKAVCTLAVLTCASSASAVVTISSSTNFPYNANVAGETYRLSENISCPTTCIVLSGAADNSVIDLNGHTMTFGTANAVTVPNADFENWTESAPNNWTVVSGSVASAAAIDWGNYDLSASDAFTIRSDAFTLTGGQTYNAWAFVRASSSASGTLRVLNASDNSVLASLALSGSDHFNRGFATNGGEGGALKYKPASNISVKLELETVGAYSYRVAEVNMAPVDHYGIVNWGYQNTGLFPDLSGLTWGDASNVTVQNGTITQGAGGASYSSAILVPMVTVSGVTINIIGPNSGGIYDFKTVTNTTINSSVTRVFNRMYGEKAAGLRRPKGYTTAITVDGVTINDFPQYGAIFYNCPSTYDNGGSVEVKNSTFKNKGVVTEPYAMAFSGAKNLSIHDNVINPNGNTGRGILIDAVGCLDPQVEGATGNIYNNQFLNIYEDQNFEYGVDGLEAVGIRIRNWGGNYEGHKINIYGNTFNYTNKAAGSHAIYGVNANANSPYDDIKIYNNSFNINAYDSSQWAAGIALQHFGNAAAPKHQIYSNTITGNSYGIGADGNDGTGFVNTEIKYNDITSSVSSIRLGISTYSGTDSGIDIFCNKLTNTGDSGYVLYLNGALSNINVDHNFITTSNSGGYEVWADENESTDVLFYGNGQIDVTGGGAVGIATSSTNGSAECYLTAGADFTYAPPTLARRLSLGGRPVKLAEPGP